jgi:hypothetical protein
MELDIIAMSTNIQWNHTVPLNKQIKSKDTVLYIVSYIRIYLYNMVYIVFYFYDFMYVMYTFILYKHLYYIYSQYYIYDQLFRIFRENKVEII